MIQGWWWKYLSVAILVYVFIKGFSGSIPEMPILEQSIRNLYFHVPLWMAMMVVMFGSLVLSFIYLISSDSTNNKLQKNKLPFHVRMDIHAAEWARVGLLFGILGIITGAIWAKVTWGAWWVFEEVKLNGAAAGILVYAAYFVLRGSIEDDDRRARVAAVYNVFAFVMYMVLINVIPRVVDSSLHPGNGGNPGFSGYDLDSSLRIVFYPAVIGWTLLAAWIINLRVRIRKIEARELYDLGDSIPVDQNLVENG